MGLAVGRVRLRQPTADGETVGEQLAGGGGVAQRDRDIRQPFVGDRQVALGLAVGRVGLRQPTADGETIGEQLAGGGGVAQRDRDIRQPFVGDRQVALGLAVGRVGLRQPTGDGETIGEQLLGAGGIAQRDRDIRQPFVGDRQVALGLAVGRVRLRQPTGGGDQRFAAIPGRRGAAGVQQGVELPIDKLKEPAAAGRHHRHDLAQQSCDRRLPCEHAGEGQRLGDDVVETLLGSEVAGHLDQIREVAPPRLDASQPHPLGPAVALRPGLGLDVNQPVGDPRVDEHIAVEAQQQRPVREPPDGRGDDPVSCPVRLGPLPREREIVDRHRGTGHRSLQEKCALVRRHRREQQLQDDVPTPEQQGIIHRLAESAIIEQVDAKPVGQIADLLGDLQQVRRTVAQQRVDELQQPWMTADRPGQGAPVIVTQLPQAR